MVVSVACPHCRILVVEATTQRFGDLAQAENTAARLGAAAISNSYGARENGFSYAFRKSYDHPGHAIVASSGDSGFTAANFPADLGYVTAVGGTELHKAHNNRGWTEDTWFAGGSGCSAYAAKPPYQHDKHCPGRTVADVSAVASNVPVYDTFYGGWITVQGTTTLPLAWAPPTAPAASEQPLPEVAAGEHVDEGHQRDKPENGPGQLRAAANVVAGGQVDPHQDHGDRMEEAEQELDNLLHGLNLPGR
jgi:hypothetical protein